MKKRDSSTVDKVAETLEDGDAEGDNPEEDPFFAMIERGRKDSKYMAMLDGQVQQVLKKKKQKSKSPEIEDRKSGINTFMSSMRKKMTHSIKLSESKIDIGTMIIPPAKPFFESAQRRSTTFFHKFNLQNFKTWGTEGSHYPHFQSRFQSKRGRSMAYFVSLIFFKHKKKYFQTSTKFLEMIIFEYKRGLAQIQKYFL